MASGIGVPEVASRNNCTSASRLPGLLVADVAATRRLERIHVRQLLFRHCFYEGSSNLGLQSVRNRSCRTYASPLLDAPHKCSDAHVNDTTGPAGRQTARLLTRTQFVTARSAVTWQSRCRSDASFRNEIATRIATRNEIATLRSQ